MPKSNAVPPLMLQSTPLISSTGMKKTPRVKLPQTAIFMAHLHSTATEHATCDFKLINATERAAYTRAMTEVLLQSMLQRSAMLQSTYQRVA